MTRDDIFNQDLGERAVYSTIEANHVIELPLTRDGFEGLLERAAKEYNLPIDDMMRLVLVAHIHHIANNENTTTISNMAKLMHKSVTNSTTWRIGEEIKEKNRKEQKAAIDEANKIKDNIVPIEGA
jgi:hypothetical protein